MQANEQPPLVSILMTAYNRRPYIEEAIQSVLKSSYQHFELIISDDASTDATVKIAQEFAEKDSRISVHRNHSNLGDYPNRNKAATYARGKYLMHVDSDDQLFAGSVQLCVSLMENNPGVHFGTYFRDPAAAPFVMKSEAALRRHFFVNPFLMIGPGGTICKLSYFRQIGGFPEKYGPANDMYFNLKAARFSDVLMIPQELFYLRRHEGQESKKVFSYLINNYRYNRDSFVELDLPFSMKEIKWLQHKNDRRFLLNILRFFLKTGDLLNTQYAIKQASFSARQVLNGIFGTVS